MSLEDLRRMEFLREEEEWDSSNHRSNVQLTKVAPTVVVGLAGCVALALGNGGWITWLGLSAFLAGLIGFIAVNIGANAVVGIRYDATEVMDGVTEVLCYGTAVRVEPSS